PLTVFAGGQPDRYWSEVERASDGCLRNTGSRKGSRFVGLPIGIRREGLDIQARQPLACRVYHPLTGEVVLRLNLSRGERAHLPQGPGAYILTGTLAE
ncbi:MAG TPA: hypothetical protein VFU47_07030, partial [Armatimonadota bacterium]|nr:hypothetical protein [Armatimonadota bacterium]